MRLMGLRPPHRVASSSGSLVIVGGAEDRSGDSAILGRLVSLCGISDPEVVVVDAASRTPARFVRHYRQTFEALGARVVHAPRLNGPQDGDTADFLSIVERAHLVYFAGGDQARLVHVLRGTRAHECLLARHSGDGVVIGGTSAGAAALSRTMISRGDSNLWPRKGSVRITEGLGFTDLIIDQHFSQRGRLGRLMEALAMPGHDARGVGVDENTALVLFPDGSGEVIGEGGVAVVTLTGDKGPSWSRTGPRDIVSLSVELSVFRSGDRIGYLGTTETAAAQDPA